jgi:hypothetical protein
MAEAHTRGCLPALPKAATTTAIDDQPVPGFCTIFLAGTLAIAGLPSFAAIVNLSWRGLQLRAMTIMQTTLDAAIHTGSVRGAKTFDLLDNELLLHTIEQGLAFTE